MIYERIGYLLYAILTILEGVVNFFIYLTFLDKKIGVLDIAIPFVFKWGRTPVYTDEKEEE